MEAFIAIPLTVNGQTYEYPESGDVDWGAEATDWAASVTSGMLQKAGGVFQLLAEVDFGTSFGVKSIYFKSRTANPAGIGAIRLAEGDLISWRNNTNDDDVSLSIDDDDVLNFDGTAISVGGAPVQTEITVSDTATINLTLAGDVLSADIQSTSITNAMISNSAAIAYSKLNLTGNLVNADINASAAIAQSKLALSITNSQLSGSAGITNANLAAMATLTIKGNNTGGSAVPSDLTGSQVTALLSDFVGDSGSGGTKGLVPGPASGDATRFLRGDGLWASPSGSGDVVGPASSTDSGFAKFDGITGKLLKNSAATLVNADIDAAAAIAWSKMENLTNSRALVSDGSGDVNVATTTATEIGYVNGVTSAIQTQLNAKMVNPMTTSGDTIYGGASGTPNRLAVGTDGQRYKLASGIPAWGFLSVTSKTTTYTATSLDEVILCSASGGSWSLTLPAAASSTGIRYYIKKTDSSANTVTVDGNGSETIDGATTYVITLQYEAITIVCDGTSWFLF